MDGSRLRRRRLLRNVLRRLDAAARDLNLVLVVIAVGLAALDLTFAVSQKTLVRLPVTRVVGDSQRRISLRRRAYWRASAAGPGTRGG